MFKNLQHDSYEVDNILFHLWFEGSCKPNWKKLISDFKRFTQSQINHFGDFPVDEYHFYFKLRPTDLIMELSIQKTQFFYLAQVMI